MVISNWTHPVQEVVSDISEYIILDLPEPQQTGGSSP